MDIFPHAFLKPFATVSCLKTGLSLGPGVMTTQHNVLLMEMLFFDSVLIIISVTILLGNLFLNNRISHPETHCPELILSG